jgi:hypothetical protein
MDLDSLGERLAAVDRDIIGLVARRQETLDSCSPRPWRSW